jgi:hypothetical protein
VTAELNQQREIRKLIGLWGAPGSGKTTYLAALNIAAQLFPRQMMLFGRDDEATDFLADHTEMLTGQRRFPPATSAQRPLAWALETTIEVPERRWGRVGKTVLVPQPYRLDIELLDAPGIAFGATAAGAAGTRLGLNEEDDMMTGGSDDEQLMEHLAACDGIVLLIDPLRERAQGDAYSYFNRTLLRIAQLRKGQSANQVGRLPHYLAVCITKFDHPTVYRMAKRSGYRSFQHLNGRDFPVVPDERAGAFFLDFCQAADRGNLRLIASAINQCFMPTRIKYFITSAIGFYTPPRGIFREADFMNIVEDASGTIIRGPINPINVIEPLLWLCQTLGANQETASRW